MESWIFVLDDDEFWVLLSVWFLLLVYVRKAPLVFGFSNWEKSNCVSLCTCASHISNAWSSINGYNLELRYRCVIYSICSKWKSSVRNMWVTASDINFLVVVLTFVNVFKEVLKRNFKLISNFKKYAIIERTYSVR